ncbi:MAG: single-stranded DNA-binding protein [Planctomycetes bacterium]|nr:single-stranded DNA-binding protein [Planctomycetota bacterium]
MTGLNRVYLLGRLTRDPELRYTGQGAAVCDFGVAVNRVYTDARGERKEEACFVDCVAWARLAEVVHGHLTKGRRVLLEGRLQYDQYQSAQGERRSRLRVVAENVQFLDGPPGTARPGERGSEDERTDPADEALADPPTAGPPAVDYPF